MTFYLIHLALYKPEKKVPKDLQNKAKWKKVKFHKDPATFSRNIRFFFTMIYQNMEN